MNSGTDLLIIEDDENLRLTLRDILEDNYRVATAENLTRARQILQERTFDLIILDLMLPDGDGYNFCLERRKSADTTPILMLTARSLEDDLVKGFEVGADDYLIKPYRAGELLVRVKALLKRSASAQFLIKDRSHLFEINGYQIDREARTVSLAGQRSIDLTSKEFDLLLYFWDNPHKAISRFQLLEHIWKNTVIDSRTIDNFVSNLKKKINLSPDQSVYIETVRGVGYRLEKRD